MQKIDTLRLIVCNARYFCPEFPASQQQLESQCVNCGSNLYQTCISGTEEMPVMCKRCYDVLKYSFGVVPPRVVSRCNSRIIRVDSEIDVLAKEELFNDIVSSPKNICHIVGDDKSLVASADQE